MGQAAFFNQYTTETVPYASWSYRSECRRLHHVLDKQLVSLIFTKSVLPSKFSYMSLRDWWWSLWGVLYIGVISICCRVPDDGCWFCRLHLRSFYTVVRHRYQQLSQCEGLAWQASAAPGISEGSAGSCALPIQWRGSIQSSTKGCVNMAARESRRLMSSGMEMWHLCLLIMPISSGVRRPACAGVIG